LTADKWRLLPDESSMKFATLSSGEPGGPVGHGVASPSRYQYCNPAPGIL
jgi:hypothetical protein